MGERLNSWEYAELYNEGLGLDGKKEHFTAEDIKAFKEGSDPYKYPDTNWHDLLLKGLGFQHQHNLNIPGGAEKVRYMGSVGYQGQDSIIKLTSKKQFNARTHLDMTPVKNLDIGLSMYLSNRKLQEPTNRYVGGMNQLYTFEKSASWLYFSGTVSQR